MAAKKSLILVFIAMGTLTSTSHAQSPGFRIESFNIIGGGGSTDNDLNNTPETLSIWSALDGPSCWNDGSCRHWSYYIQRGDQQQYARDRAR